MLRRASLAFCSSSTTRMRVWLIRRQVCNPLAWPESPFSRKPCGAPLPAGAKCNPCASALALEGCLGVQTLPAASREPLLRAAGDVDPLCPLEVVHRGDGEALTCLRAGDVQPTPGEAPGHARREEREEQNADRPHCEQSHGQPA